MKDNLNNTVWDNKHIFKDFHDPKLHNKFESLDVEIKKLAKSCLSYSSLLENNDFDLNVLEKLISNKRRSMDLWNSLYTMRTFASSQLSTDTVHKEARELRGKLGILASSLEKGIKPMELYLKRAPEQFVCEFLKDERVSEVQFELHYSRKRNNFLLELGQETLLTGLSNDGLHAWGDLYNSIAGQLKVKIADETIGLASAASLTKQGDREKRKLAFCGIQNAWKEHEESAAAILNAINGWRLEESRFRSHSKESHYLDLSCHQSRITPKTLETLIDTTYEARDIGHRALRAMAKVLKLDKLAPYDLLSPMPIQDGEETSTSFPEAIEIISHSFSRFSPAMGDFAKMMAKNNWIDSRPTPSRAQGAYCTRFKEAREPRVFITYQGSMSDILTLAHEIGHAYHSWVMRDLPLTKTHYSMTLAETASIFAETLVRDTLLDQAQTKEKKLKILWQEAESAGSLLINIPARYEFEKRMVEKRKERPLSPKELCQEMNHSWAKWYESTVSEYDSMFWASKLHFSISGIGFYNYPYLFGYLFSLGIYGQKDNHGDQFNQLYLNILRDTGSMTAEDLVKKHLSQDIESPEFWKTSLNIVEKSVSQFENLIG